MEQETGRYPGLDATCRMIARTAPRVEVLLARFFPSAGGCLYPDAAGDVCVAESSGRAADRPASIYAGCVAKLGGLVTAFSAAALDQAALACIRLAKERTVFACALDFARNPRDPMQRQLFVARMMPAPVSLHRQDDATASSIWLRLWTLHAWILELQLVMALSGPPNRSDQALLLALDQHFADLLRADAAWLTVDLGRAAPAEMVARAPADALGVGNLAWPNALGAMLPEGDACQRSLRQAGLRVSEEDGRSWVRFGARYADMPCVVAGSLPSPARATREAWLG
jgi:hypothetical protein